MATTLLLIADVWGDHHDFDGGWVVMMAGMLFFWSLVIVGIVFLVRHLTTSDGWRRPAADGGHSEGALEVLDRRFAQGEISTEEYRERRAVLRGDGPGGG